MRIPNPLLFAKRLKRYLLCSPPRGIQAGKGVQIHRPHSRIRASKQIKIGARTEIGPNALIVPILEYAGVRHCPEIRIGEDVYIGPNVYLVCAKSVSIGDGCVLSESVFLNDNGHGLDPEAGLIMNQPLVEAKPIEIGKACFLGLRCAVMPGVTLGDHCVVGINSVVTKSFPPYSMIAGAPARLVRSYSLEHKTWMPPNP